jgi:hypothetical protein
MKINIFSPACHLKWTGSRVRYNKKIFSLVCDGAVMVKKLQVTRQGDYKMPTVTQHHPSAMSALL